MSIAPSGEQVVLCRGDQRAVVVEVGGGLREYTLAGEPLLDGYAADERCRSGRGQILAPWPNRLQDGSYRWEGETQQLALSEPPRRNAIHGLVRWVSWTATEQPGSSVKMSHVLHPQDGYPFTLELEVVYTLSADGLSVQSTARNAGVSACPYGIGAHPYLTLGGDLIDDCLLHVEAESCLRNDERAIPVETVSVQGGANDFRQPRMIGETRLDTCFCDLKRDADGLARVVLRAPEGGRGVCLWMDERHPYVMLYTGDTLPDERRRRRSLAVEPMSCAPNAFRSGAGLQTLAPGACFSGRWGITALRG